MKLIAVLAVALILFAPTVHSAENSSATNRIFIPFVVSRTGHILITVKINEVDAHLLVDTAAGASVIHSKLVKALGLKPTEGDSIVKGLGTSSYKMMNLEIPEMVIADTSYRNLRFIALNLEHVEEAGGKRILYGILGSTFLQQHEALIDYKLKTISFNKPAEKKITETTIIIRH